MFRHITKTGQIQNYSITDALPYNGFVGFNCHEIGLNENKKYLIKNLDFNIGSYKSIDSAFPLQNTYYFRFFITENVSKELITKFLSLNDGINSYWYEGILSNTNFTVSNEDILDSSNFENYILLRKALVEFNVFSLSLNRIKTQTVAEFCPILNTSNIAPNDVNSTVPRIWQVTVNNNKPKDFIFDSRYGTYLGFSFLPSINYGYPQEFLIKYTINFDLIEEDF